MRNAAFDRYRELARVCSSDRLRFETPASLAAGQSSRAVATLVSVRATSQQEFAGGRIILTVAVCGDAVGWVKWAKPRFGGAARRSLECSNHSRAVRVGLGWQKFGVEERNRLRRCCSAGGTSRPPRRGSTDQPGATPQGTTAAAPQLLVMTRSSNSLRRDH